MILTVTKYQPADGSLWSTYELAQEHEKTLGRLDCKRQYKELAQYQNILKKQRARAQQNLAWKKAYCNTAERYALEGQLNNITHTINTNTSRLRLMHRELGHV